MTKKGAAAAIFFGVEYFRRYIGFRLNISPRSNNTYVFVCVCVCVRAHVFVCSDRIGSRTERRVEEDLYWIGILQQRRPFLCKTPHVEDDTNLKL